MLAWNRIIIWHFRRTLMLRPEGDQLLGPWLCTGQMHQVAVLAAPATPLGHCLTPSPFWAFRQQILTP